LSISKLVLKVFEKNESDKTSAKAIKQHYIKIRSAELIKEMDNEKYITENIIETAIINIKIEFAKEELERYQEKIDDSNKKIKGCYLSKKQRKIVMNKIANLKSDLKNLFFQRDLIFI